METLGPVWFVCLDAPVPVYQSPDLATFVGDYLCFQAAPHDGPVAEVVNESIQRVWTQTLDVPRAQLLDAPNGDVDGFELAPRGGRLVYVLQTTGVSIEIRSVPIAGGEGRLLSNTAHSFDTFTPDGNRMLYTDSGELYIVPLSWPRIGR